MISLTHRSVILISAQLIFILTSGLWQKHFESPVIPVLLYIVLFATGGFMLANSRKWLILYIAFTVSGVTLKFASTVAVVQVISILLLTVSHVLLFRQIFRHIFKPTTVLVDRLLSGVAGYLWLGIFWALQLDWARIETTDAFRAQSSGNFVEGPELLYYSFVTLTTLGYGDIVPMTWLAKSLSIFTSSSGVLYIAIFISAIVASSEFRMKTGES